MDVITSELCLELLARLLTIRDATSPTNEEEDSLPLVSDHVRQRLLKTQHDISQAVTRSKALAHESKMGSIKTKEKRGLLARTGEIFSLRTRSSKTAVAFETRRESVGGQSVNYNGQSPVPDTISIKLREGSSKSVRRKASVGYLGTPAEGLSSTMTLPLPPLPTPSAETGIIAGGPDILKSNNAGDDTVLDRDDVISGLSRASSMSHMIAGPRLNSSRQQIQAHPDREVNGAVTPNTACVIAPSGRQNKRGSASVTLGLSKKMTLIAVAGFLDLTTERNMRPVMLYIFGTRIFNVWNRYRLAFSRASWLLFLYLFGGFFILPTLIIPLEVRSTLHALMLVCACIVFGANTSQMNAAVLRLLLRSFDTWFFVFEVFAFSSSLWSVYCFEATYFVYCLSFAIAMTAVWLPYDTFPTSFRRALRASYVIGTCVATFYIGFLYANQMHIMCFYEVHMPTMHVVLRYSSGALTGKQAPDQLTNARSLKEKFSVSMFDFCLNQGFTLVFLMCRITWSVIRTPDESVLLMSNYRLYEKSAIGQQLPISASIQNILRRRDSGAGGLPRLSLLPKVAASLLTPRRTEGGTNETKSSQGGIVGETVTEHGGAQNEGTFGVMEKNKQTKVDLGKKKEEDGFSGADNIPRNADRWPNKKDSEAKEVQALGEREQEVVRSQTMSWEKPDIGAEESSSSLLSLAQTLSQTVYMTTMKGLWFDEVTLGYLAAVQTSINLTLEGAPLVPSLGRLQQRTLLAIQPVIYLNSDQSRRTLMMTAFGSRFFKAWFLRRKVLGPISWCLFSFVGFHLFIMPRLSTSEQSQAFVAILGLATNFLVSLAISAYVNARLLSVALRTFDTWLLLIEACFFTSSMWSIFCFRVSGFFYCLSFAIACNWFIFYDCYPSKFRAQMKYGYIIALVGGIMLWTSLYFRSFSDDMCVYDMDLQNGLQLRDDSSSSSSASFNSTGISSALSAPPSASSGVASSILLSMSQTNGTAAAENLVWTMSVFDFCMNRGFTILVLLIKITVGTIIKRDDSVIVGSYYSLRTERRKQRFSSPTGRRHAVVPASSRQLREDIQSTQSQE